MTITREQVADLQPGDVVELRHSDWPDTVITGPLRSERTGELVIADLVLRWTDGSVATWARDLGNLTVISRAPRPLYVNHDRTESVPGDVMRDKDGDIWFSRSTDDWISNNHGDGSDEWVRQYAPLILLVDGETGQVVP